MKLGRVLLLLGALLLAVTAAFHGSGGAMVAGWLDGQRGAVLSALWWAPALNWSVVALLWCYVALRGGPDARIAAMVAAAIPLGAAVLLGSAVGFGFPGIWMLLGAALLATAGATLLGRASPRNG